MKQNAEAFKVSAMCRTLSVSRSGYYEWLSRPLSQRRQDDKALSERICEHFEANRRVYGQWQSQMPSRFIDEMDPGAVETIGDNAPAQPQASSLYDRAAQADGYNSPGWKRLQARIGQRGMSQPREAKSMMIDAGAVSSFTTGERVFHDKFGYGHVLTVDGNKLEIAFDKAGTKKVIDSFVTPA